MNQRPDQEAGQAAGEQLSKRAQLVDLHQTLIARLNLEGLRDLCFQLGVPYDDLAGETLSGRARELVLRMDRQGRTAELAEAVQRLGALAPARLPDKSLSKGELRALRNRIAS